MNYSDYIQREQNCTLMITTVDDNGHTVVSAIPMCIDDETMHNLATVGLCKNKEILEWNYGKTPAEFWQEYWNIATAASQIEGKNNV